MKSQKNGDGIKNTQEKKLQSATNDSTNTLRIGLQSLLFAAGILLLLMTITGVLTRYIPSGVYSNTPETENSRELLSSFSYTTAPNLPVWRWYSAPVEVLWGPDNLTIISILISMLCIAGAIQVMNKGGILTYLITSIVTNFTVKRYKLEAVIILIFMLFGSILGSMEEVVVLVPLLVALAQRMGWNKVTGLGLSLGAIAFGFASAISNPFTVGVAQKVAGIPVFSGIVFRIIIFSTIYVFYTLYVIRTSPHNQKSGIAPETLRYSNKITIPEDSQAHFRKAVFWFTTSMISMVAVILASAVIPDLSDYILPIVVLFFLIGGIGSGIKAAMEPRAIRKAFFSGAGGVAPGIILVLMAASIKHIMAEAGIMDTILYLASKKIIGMKPFQASLMIYGVVLLFNFFISSGSAKAFLIMPIAAPLADAVGLSRQTAVLAYIFGDGFSNIIYPSNALLLICLSISGVSYGTWFKWIWKIELIILLITIAFLKIAVTVGY